MVAGAAGTRRPEMADSGGPHLHHHPHRLSGLAARKGRLPEGSRREQVIGTLKAAFVPGRLTEDEFEARAGHVYASRTYAELTEVTADIPSAGFWSLSEGEPKRSNSSCSASYGRLYTGIERGPT